MKHGVPILDALEHISGASSPVLSRIARPSGETIASQFPLRQAARPVKGYYHDYSNCGWHYSVFDREAGSQEFREEVNAILADYAGGFELSEDGEILQLADQGMQPLVDAELPHYDPPNVEKRVEAAIRKFRRYRSSAEDRKDAIRDLSDVLEYLRPQASELFLTRKDDDALFQIANQFAIRHHDGRQKGDYSMAIWHSWIFYVYLATIHAAVRIINERGHPA